MDFGRWLKKELAERGIPQRVLADLTGKDEKQVSYWVRGKRRPRMEALETILDALGYHMEFIRNKRE